MCLIHDVCSDSSSKSVFVYTVIATFVACLIFLAVVVGTNHRIHVTVMYALNSLVLCGTWGLLSQIVDSKIVFIVCEIIGYTVVVFTATTGAYFYPFAFLCGVSTTLYCICESRTTEFMLCCLFVIYSYLWTIEHAEIVFTMFNMEKKYTKTASVSPQEKQDVHDSEDDMMSIVGES
jgi:hypothetical protein